MTGFLETPGWRGRAALEPAHASARGVPGLARGDRRSRLSAPRRAHHRPVPQPFLRRRDLDAGRILRSTTGIRRRAKRGNGPSRATISNGRRCWSTLPKRAARRTWLRFGRKLYASAIASGLNRATGLAYGAVSRQGLPLDHISRSWPQTEAIKAAIALDGTGGPDLKPEIEERVGRLFRWHIDPAPHGLVDRPASTSAAARWPRKCRPASSITW